MLGARLRIGNQYARQIENLPNLDQGDDPPDTPLKEDRK